MATLSMVRQIGGEGPASDANWWADYAEHITLLAVAVLVASSARPGWRVLTAAAAAAWLYLGLVSAVFIPDVDGSWGVLGGSAAMLVGAVLGGLTLADASRRWRLWPKQHPRPVA